MKKTISPFYTALLFGLAGISLTDPPPVNNDDLRDQAYALAYDIDLADWAKRIAPNTNENENICYDPTHDMIGIRDHTREANVFWMSTGFYKGISMEWAGAFLNARDCSLKESLQIEDNQGWFSVPRRAAYFNTDATLATLKK